MGTGYCWKILIALEALATALIYGAGAGFGNQVANGQDAATTIRDVAGVKLRPEAAEILDAVERLYKKPVSVILRDDLREGVQGYTYMTEDGAPTQIYTRYSPNSNVIQAL